MSFSKEQNNPPIIDHKSLPILIRELALLLWELGNTKKANDIDALVKEEGIFLKKTLNQFKINASEKQKVVDLLISLFENLQIQVENINYEFKEMLLHSFFIDTKGIVQKQNIIPIEIRPRLKKENEIIGRIIEETDRFLSVDSNTNKIFWNISPQDINHTVRDLMRLDITLESPEECDKLVNKFIKQREWTLIEKKIKRKSVMNELPEWALLTFQDQLSDEFFQIQVMTLEIEKLKSFEKNADATIRQQKTSSFLTQNINALLMELGILFEGTHLLL